MTLAAVFALAGATVAVVTLPRWLVRPLLRHALWRLRDEIFDAARRGELQYSHAAVLALIRRIELSIKYSNELSLVRFAFAKHVARGLSRDAVDRLMSEIRPDLAGMSPSERDAFEAYDRRFGLTLVRIPLIGTPLGLLVLTLGVALSPLVVAYYLAFAPSRSAEATYETTRRGRLLVEETVLGQLEPSAYATSG